MKHPVSFSPIPADRYNDYRLEVIFKGFKWDPQVGDVNTIAPGAALIKRESAQWLYQMAEGLAAETQAMEGILLRQPKLWSELGLPREILRVLSQSESYNSATHVRLMRFDFHPTPEGWAISEVNSDVPGGWAEASVLPQLAAKYCPQGNPSLSLAETLANALQEKISPGGRVAYVFATSYSDDRQVMEFFAQEMDSRGYPGIMLAPDHLRWQHGQAVAIARGQEGPVAGIIRFYPSEWLGNLPKGAEWQGYFSSHTPSCNHPVAILTQSKRLPLVWDRLGVPLPHWRALLPETTDPRKVNWRDQGWVVKPALGRVGEDISVRESITHKEWREISLGAWLFPGDWVAQRRFTSMPVQTPEGPMHICIGVFTVDGKAAGLYGRISRQPRIDARAMDIPVLIGEEE